MSSLIKYKNKKNGVTYIYESVSYWDKDKQQGRSKRKCIGKLDENGNVIPNRPKAESKPKFECQDSVKRLFYGATYLFDLIGEKIGVTEDLKQCFPSTYKQILSIGYYLIMEDRNPLSRFSKWASTHKHPCENDIPSQRSSEIFASISEEARQNFFVLQAKRRVESEYWVYDTTSVSSYSKTLNQIQRGYNKEDDKLEQLNVALLFGEQSNLPFYYRQLPGNITDVMTVKNLLSDMSFLGEFKPNLVMDRGFYKRANVDELYKEHYKFLMGAKISVKQISQAVDSNRGAVRMWENYCANYDVYGKTIPITWSSSVERPRKGDTITENHRMYLHIYYDAQRAIDEERTLNLNLSKLEDELIKDHLVGKHSKMYDKYFEVKTTQKRVKKVIIRQEAVEEAKKNHGFFVLISNQLKDPFKALEIYRNKDVVEKAFNDLKDRLNCRRLAVSSELSLSGKLFVEFIAIIYLSYIKKQMQNKDLYKKYTIQGILDKLDIIECYERNNHKIKFSEITSEQSALFRAMDVTPPA